MKKVVIHCSDSAWGNAIAINDWHSQRGWSGCGYHYVILNGSTHTSKEFDPIADGLVETGRRYNVDGAHVKGHNKNSIGICLIGKSGEFTDDQYESLNALLNALEDQYKELSLYQHSDLDSKKPYCAGIDWVRIDRDLIIKPTK